MIELVMVRHGPTAWNAEGRMQGRSDQPLSQAGRLEVGTWRVPAAFHGHIWVVSPLGRTRETAALLGHPDAELEPAVIETDWGDWEGCRLEDLREQYGDRMAAMEALGLDFRPPGGERPRDVQDRLRPWLARLAETGRPTVAVCHRGVIRALYSLATGWDFTGKPPVKLQHGTAHRFRVEATGKPGVVQMNLPLTP
jgi:broad specificity phosphatase PhoE